VTVRCADSKRLVHPELGPLEFLCETLVSGVGDQILVVLYPRPGTDTRDKHDLLRVIGTQDLTASP
jgi:hypothetical protein